MITSANKYKVLRTKTMSLGPRACPQGYQDASARLEAEVFNTCNYIIKHRIGYLILIGKTHFIII